MRPSRWTPSCRGRRPSVTTGLRGSPPKCRLGRRTSTGRHSSGYEKLKLPPWYLCTASACASTASAMATAASKVAVRRAISRNRRAVIWSQYGVRVLRPQPSTSNRSRSGRQPGRQRLRTRQALVRPMCSTRRLRLCLRTSIPPEPGQTGLLRALAERFSHIPVPPREPGRPLRTSQPVGASAITRAPRAGGTKALGRHAKLRPPRRLADPP